MLKADLRKEYKNLRKQLTFDQLMDSSLAIANNCLSLPNLPDGSQVWNKTYFHLFLPIEAQLEINTEFLLQILAGKDKEVIVSKSDFDTRKMSHFLLTDNTKLKVNQYGIPEPVDGIEVPTHKIEVVFVPLLAYDKKGNRVGYGKGFYDLFLSECKPDTIKVGLSFFEPEENITDILENDIKLDFCVTPETIYKF